MADPLKTRPSPTRVILPNLVAPGQTECGSLVSCISRLAVWTSDPDFKVTTFFEVEYCIKKRRVLKTKLLTIAQEGTVPSVWNGIMFGDLD